MSDEELLSRIRRGDAAAWRELHARHVRSLWRYVWALVGDKAAAEDIVADTMLVLVRSIDEVHTSSGSLTSWLRGVLRHKVLDYFRHRKREQRSMVAVGSMSIAESPTDSFSPSAHLEQKEQERAVWMILKRLKEDERLVLEWKYLDELTVRDIAERLSLTEKAVEMILYRARIEFRRLHSLDQRPEL